MIGGKELFRGRRQEGRLVIPMGDTDDQYITALDPALLPRDLLLVKPGKALLRDLESRSIHGRFRQRQRDPPHLFVVGHWNPLLVFNVRWLPLIHPRALQDCFSFQG